LPFDHDVQLPKDDSQMSFMILFAAFFLALPVPTSSNRIIDYDPSTSSEAISVQDAEFEYGDDDRQVPLKIYLPESRKPCPVILFSHGLGGAKDNNPYLGRHWAGRGYVVVFMQHQGSDETVWKKVPRRDRMKKLKAAASGQNLQRRTDDVPATLDQLKKWNEPGQKLAGRLDLENIGMSGHSFGAVTTQAVSGQSYGRRGQVFTDARIQAAIAMSPSVPQFGNPSETFANVEVPWLLMTGTKDESAVGRTNPQDRRKVFQQLPRSGHFYELVLHDAEHMAFSERKLSGGRHRNPKHHKVILALSSAFWDAYLKNNSAAKDWLNGDQAKKILEPKDLWQRK
jgi:predicted dienelactone hydrolase